MAGIDIVHLQEWSGRSQSGAESVTSLQAAQLSALFDRLDPVESGAVVPGLWHWANAFPPVRQSSLGSDGHPVRGGFLPPVPLPRRMWAGGALSFERPLLIDVPFQRLSRIGNVTLKEGGTGPLVFVEVHHELSQDGEVAIVETQNIVYRDDQPAGQQVAAGKPAPTDGETVLAWRPDEVALFRYSAATFNGHRIHYDRAYARDVEGYPGLVVQGPFTATMLFTVLSTQLARPIARFSYRGMKPLFAGRDVTIAFRKAGDGQYAVWAADDEGAVGMMAEAQVMT